MINLPDEVPRIIEEVTASAPAAGSSDLRDWELAEFVVRMSLRSGARVFQAIHDSARLNTDLHSWCSKLEKLRVDQTTIQLSLETR
jgi:hypothetical protein